MNKPEFNLREYVKKISYDTRLLVDTQMTFVNLITELGYRENKAWTDDEDELLNKLNAAAKRFSERQISEIEKWINDGAELRFENKQK